MSSEAVVQQQARLIVSRLQGLAYRNNSGVAIDETGRHIRYGLANESAQENKVIKSSDLICCVPTLIQPHMVGYYLGVFTALEVKHSGWHLTPGDKRGQAQARFHQIVRDACGFAGFVSDPSDVYRIIGREQS